ncbi:ABC transporter permease [Acrocarpospora catenulata]|uniref:ABC transporter permease n=1 Tax=Acrocarpospora catenulata TaxID=2836182 RepID=UPI001BD928F7|nr:ABC-2 family transporter protein [Acrocarpospora catenulata]
MRNLRRTRDYLRMLRVFHRDSVRAEIAYRADFLAGLVMTLYWLAWAILGVALFYRFTDTILDWTFPEALTVLGMFFLMNGLRQFLVSPNLRQMAEHIRLGTLDYLLLKPASPQFLVSLRRFNPVLWPDLVLGLATAVTGAILYNGPPGVALLLLFAVTLIAAVLIVYALGLTLLSLLVWTVQADGLDDLITAVFEVGRFPVDFYGGFVARLFTFVLPVALLTTLPALALLSRLSLAGAGIAMAVAVIGLVLSSLLWRIALRSYAGASA